MASCTEQFLKVSWNSVQRSKRSSKLEIGTDGQTDRQTMEDGWSEKLTWAFSSGELKTFVLGLKSDTITHYACVIMLNFLNFQAPSKRPVTFNFNTDTYLNLWSSNSFKDLLLQLTSWMRFKHIIYICVLSWI